MKNKPDLGFWKLWDLSFGFLGVQIAYALQSANVSRIFTTIGADPHSLSYFWILPPLMGMLIQPVIGIMSDRTWTRFGRRLPYLLIGASLAVIVMCLLPNTGSFHFSVSGAIIFGMVALMLLDTSINMAMQPFKMLVGDMVNDRQKSKAYSIQSFLCNAGSIIGFILPFCLGWIGLKNVAPDGTVPPTVVWSFYIGAAVLLGCVIYSLIKIKEWPPKLYNEYNGISSTAGNNNKTGLISLMRDAPSTFWTVGIVQFFCWFAFLFLWTYSTNTVAFNAFKTPATLSVVGLTDGCEEIKAPYILLNDSTIIIENGQALVRGVTSGGVLFPASLIIVNGNDTIVENHRILKNKNGNPKVSIENELSAVNAINIDGKNISGLSHPVLVDYLYNLKGPVSLTKASLAVKESNGRYALEDSETIRISDAALIKPLTKIVLNSSSPQYNEAGNWVGLLYAVQALGSVGWALLLTRFRNRKFSYAFSLLLSGIGFIMLSFITDKWVLFIAELLIGCGWAAMLAWPFTILTNSLKGGNIGTYLGLFNCTICLPQIIAALMGGWILSMISNPGEPAPEYLMMTVAGVSILIGAAFVYFIKDEKSEKKPAETYSVSDNI